MPELEERQAKVEGILEQIDKRVGRVESEVSGLRIEINSLRDEMRSEIGELRTKMDTNFRWLVGIMITMWVTMILAIIFKA